MRCHHRRASILAATVIACSGAPPPPPATPPPVAVTVASAAPVTASAAPKPPADRLPATAIPQRYHADLTIDPTKATFGGVIDIDIDLRAATSVLWLNGTDLTIADAIVTFGGKSESARVTGGHADDDFVGFGVAAPIGPGPTHLHVSYSGNVSALETQGVFREQQDDRWYTFSQFESTDARRAFPCFDEPALKATWQLTLHVPAADVAVSNTVEATATVGRDGMKKVVFTETKPLSSYLIAFGVGPFEVLDAGKSKGGVPIRIIVPHGKADYAKFAVASTAPILSLLEDYFGTPYPFGKLDELVIPKTVAFGAMENPGLVTYADAAILSKPGERNLRSERIYATDCAHELAHQWFGDLVTLAWWDDTWLNESFASWMESKIVAIWQPTWGEDLGRIDNLQNAIELDSKASSRAIRQPIHNAHDINDAFDILTYFKGESVLEMLESYLGPETFQNGVRAYLAAHAWGNATEADFLAALSAAAGHDVAPAVQSFIDQPGAPLISAEVVCSPGAKRSHVTLSQRRYLPAGSTPDAGQRLWNVPVCVRSPAGRTCTLLTAASADVDLPDASCPAWLVGNAEAAGYYRVAYDQAQLGKLAGAKLPLADRLGLVGDVTAAMMSNALPAGDALAFVLPLLADPSRHMAKRGVAFFREVRHLIGDELRPQYAAVIRKIYGSRARALGFLPRPGDSDDARQLRAEIVPFVADEGEDPSLARQARALVNDWLAHRKTLDQNTLNVVIPVAARHGDRVLFDAFIAALHDKSVGMIDRERVLRGVGNFRDPTLAGEAITLLLDPSIDVRETLGMLREVSRDDVTRQINYDFLKLHYDAVMARMPEPVRGHLQRLADGFCDEAHRADFEAFFKPRAEKVLSGPSIYAHTVESIDQCIAIRKLQGPSIKAFLEAGNRPRAARLP